MKSFKNWLRAKLAFIVDCLGLGLGPCRFSFDNPLAEDGIDEQQSVKQQSVKQSFLPPPNKLSEKKDYDNRKKIKRTGKRGK